MTTTRRLARLIGSLGFMAALTVPTGAAIAAPSQHISNHQLYLAAEFATDSAVISLMLVVDDLGSGGGVEAWVPPESFFNGEPPTIVAGEADLSATSDDSAMTGSVDLHVAATGEFIGRILVDVALEPFGAAETATSSQAGNHKLRVSQTVQPMTASGTLGFPAELGGTLDLTDAYSVGANATDYEEFTNTPSSTVASTDVIEGLVGWQRDGITVMVLGSADRTLSYIDVAVILPDGTVLNGGQDNATFGRRAIEADVSLMPPEGQGLAATSGTLTVRADVTAGERTSFVVEDGDAQVRVTEQVLIADGTVEVSLDDGTFLSLDFADASGTFVDRSARLIDGGRQD